MIAALFVAERGCYVGLDGVDPWPESRDARLYAGPWPVVAHPPCQRWGRYWSGGPNASYRRELGADSGCFAAALESVRRFGGVLEHPEASHAWRSFGLERPPHAGGWVRSDDVGWTCCVAQGNYGHPAQKLTWLYAVVEATALPELTWGRVPGRTRIEEGFRCKASALAARARKDFVPVKRLSAEQRLATPPAFRDVLLSIARSARVAS